MVRSVTLDSWTHTARRKSHPSYKEPSSDPKKSSIKVNAKRYVFNIGYQGKSVSEVCELLKSVGVKRLIDVRAVAWSHRPQFRKTALANFLRKCGVEYVQCREAGNPYRAVGRKNGSFETCKRLYTRHLSKHPEVLERMHDLIRNTKAAVFCYELDRKQCHRSVLLKELKSRSKRLKVMDL